MKSSSPITPHPSSGLRPSGTWSHGSWSPGARTARTRPSGKAVADRPVFAFVLSGALVAWAILAAATVLAAPPAPVQAPPPTVITPQDIHSTRIELSPSQAGCTTTYDNTGNFTGEFYSGQNGAEAIDDLHAVEGGGLCSFTFGYNEPGAGLVDATVTFYFQDGSDPPPAMIAAGPFTVTGLPAGANSIEVTIPGAPVLSVDIWMGVQFSSTTAGLLISDPPVVGSSHDFYYENGNYFFFGGNPRANFFLSLTAELAVPVTPSTWGRLKTRYP